MEDSRPQLKICPFMSNQCIAPVPNAKLTGPNGIPVASFLVPCVQEQCGAAYCGDDGHFLGCGLAVAPELDKLQVSLARTADAKLSSLSAGDALYAIEKTQHVLEDLLAQLVQVIGKKRVPR
jgi:hypothetical protein